MNRIEGFIFFMGMAAGVPIGGFFIAIVIHKLHADYIQRIKKMIDNEKRD